jgi:WhiB family redox-sensing transcriptional regulator
MNKDDMTWMEYAACRKYDAVNANWYADPATPEQRLAINICFSVCPVKSQCLSHAILTEERHGVWGGLTVKQRQILARQKGQLRFAELALRNY